MAMKYAYQAFGNFSRNLVIFNSIFLPSKIRLFNFSEIKCKRYNKVLEKLISPDQPGFVKGRYIGQRLIIDLLEQTEFQEIPGVLLLLDFKKAFDTAEWFAI